MGWFLDGVGDPAPKLAPGSFVVKSVVCEQGVNLWVWFDYKGGVSLST